MGYNLRRSRTVSHTVRTVQHTTITDEAAYVVSNTS